MSAEESERHERDTGANAQSNASQRAPTARVMPQGPASEQQIEMGPVPKTLAEQEPSALPKAALAAIGSRGAPEAAGSDGVQQAVPRECEQHATPSGTASAEVVIPLPANEQHGTEAPKGVVERLADFFMQVLFCGLLLFFWFAFYLYIFEFLPKDVRTVVNVLFNVTCMLLLLLLSNCFLLVQS